MKRFFLFVHEQYYPAGGWGDFRGDFHSIDDAKAAAQREEFGDNFEIVDTSGDGELILEGIAGRPITWARAVKIK